MIQHFEKGDHVRVPDWLAILSSILHAINIVALYISTCLKKVSALVTGEYYTRKEHFPGFARPFVFNAEVLLK